jgi:hypothetical protein
MKRTTEEIEELIWTWIVVISMPTYLALASILLG